MNLMFTATASTVVLLLAVCGNGSSVSGTTGTVGNRASSTRSGTRGLRGDKKVSTVRQFDLDSAKPRCPCQCVAKIEQEEDSFPTGCQKMACYDEKSGRSGETLCFISETKQLSPSEFKRERLARKSELMHTAGDKRLRSHSRNRGAGANSPALARQIDIYVLCACCSSCNHCHCLVIVVIS